MPTTPWLSLFIQENEVVHSADEFIEDGCFRFFDGFGVFALLELRIGGLDELKLAIVRMRST